MPGNLQSKNYRNLHEVMSLKTLIYALKHAPKIFFKFINLSK